ncbi:MAG: hypothetical protein GKR92_00185 [Gammaproteobacteria bacterium]|nr:MAG: hypothetical protein GKR92_00185 [Gammaproteobacteria bacterium]
MIEIIKTLLDICLLRKGPEDLPSDLTLMLLLIGVSLVVSFWLGSMIHDLQIAGLSSVAGLFFSFVFTKILVLKNPERFTQTFCAMLGTVTLINLISAPVIYPLSKESLGGSLVTLFALLSFALLIWVVIVYGFIFSRAISSLLRYGVAISICYALLSIIILELFLAARVAN